MVHVLAARSQAQVKGNRLKHPQSCRSEPNAVELKSAIREHLLNLSNELSTSIK